MAIRFSGLSSGLDTESMVTELMKAQRTSVNTLWKKKTQLEWKKADYNTMYKAIKEFRDNTVFNYKLESTLVMRKATSTNETQITATANASAVAFTHNIAVDQLAQGASMTSAAKITHTGSTGKSTLADHIGVSGIISLSISDGKTTKALDNTGSGTYDTTDKSIYDLVSDINKLGLNVKASYDATLDRFFLSSAKTGAANQITLTSVDGTGTGAGSLMEKLQFGADATLSTVEPALPATLPANFTTGKDAQFILDGVSLTQAANTFTISGVTYNLKGEGAAQVVVTSDTDQAVENAKKFVEAYNALLEKINNEVKEAKYRDFLPLTDAEKAELKDTQITSYEEKARSGILRNDTILTNLVSQMRSNIYGAVSGVGGKYTTLSSIGITTGKDYLEGGKLYLDETKLKKALEEDPDILKKLFGSDGATGSQDGIAVRLHDTLKTALDKIETTAGLSASITGDTTSTLARSIRNYNTRLDNMEDRLQSIEDRYYRQFTAMEKAFEQLNAQSSWLTSLFNSNTSK